MSKLLIKDNLMGLNRKKQSAVHPKKIRKTPGQDGAQKNAPPVRQRWVNPKDIFDTILGPVSPKHRRDHPDCLDVDGCIAQLFPYREP